jgi:tetratricopeptide (TPR) repeat protein
VRYILEGSVRKSDNRIRVNAELIDSRTEQNCWSERYDRDLDDLFAVQDEITRNITLAMKVHLDDGDMALQRSAGTSNIKAWQLTLTAVDLQDTYIRENILEARVMANEAIILDPAYPFAWIVLGWTHWQEAYSGWCENFEIPLTEAEKANQQARSLNPDYAEAWSQAGLIHMMKHESDKAQAACRRAVELEPGNAEIQALRAFSLTFIGDYGQARKHNLNMLKLCPVLPNWYYLVGGQIEQLSGNHDEAIHAYQQGIDVEPESPLCRFYLIDALMEQGDEPRAKILADEIRALDQSVTGRGLVRTHSQDKTIRDRFQANLAKFDLL